MAVTVTAVILISFVVGYVAGVVSAIVVYKDELDRQGVRRG